MSRQGMTLRGKLVAMTLGVTSRPITDYPTQAIRG